MMTRRLPIVFAVALLAIVVLASGPANAGDPLARWALTGPPWTPYGPFHVYPVDDTQCTIDLGMWTQELGKSGIARFAYEVQLRGQYDPGDIHLPAKYKSGYWWGPDYPDDERDFWTGFVVPPRWVYVQTDKTPTVWVKVVGERPGFWNTDDVMMAKIGRPDCATTGAGAIDPNAPLVEGGS